MFGVPPNCAALFYCPEKLEFFLKGVLKCEMHIVLFFIVSNSTQVKVFQVVLQLNARILEVLIGHHLMLLD